jgi:hypothetical protein
MPQADARQRKNNLNLGVGESMKRSARSEPTSPSLKMSGINNKLLAQPDVSLAVPVNCNDASKVVLWLYWAVATTTRRTVSPGCARCGVTGNWAGTGPMVGYTECEPPARAVLRSPRAAGILLRRPGSPRQRRTDRPRLRVRGSALSLRSVKCERGALW